MIKQFNFNNPRSIIIELSVRIEHMINNMVSLTLGIDKSESICFGNSSRSLNFNSKINLLQDLKYFNKTDKEKFNRFAEIRNKFAHLVEVATFQDCLDSLSGLEKDLKKWYPKIEPGLTDSAENYLRELTTELDSHANKFLDYHNNKLTVELEQKAKSIVFDRLLDSIGNLVSQEYPNDDHIKVFVGKLLVGLNGKI